MKKILMKINKGTIVGILVFMVAILLMGGFLWSAFLEDYIPYTKTNFKDYKSFQKKKQVALFPNKLPSTVRDTLYYYYTGYNDSKSGIAFVVKEEEEYKLLKEAYVSEYLEYYRDLGEEDNMKYVFDQSLTDDLIQEMKIEFLYQFLKNSVSDYKIAAYEKIEGEHMDCIRIIICNDKTREMIIFDSNDAHSTRQ